MKKEPKVYVKRSYRKLNKPYWYGEPNFVLAGYLFLIALAVMCAWVSISKYVNRDPLVSPLVINPVGQVYAESISCESPRGYLECLAYNGTISWQDHAKLSKIIDCESKWNPNALHVNRSGSVDRGIFQINNKFHSKLSNEDAFNFKKNIDYGIKLYKKSGVSPWTCKYIINN